MLLKKSTIFFFFFNFHLSSSGKSYYVFQKYSIPLDFQRKAINKNQPTLISALITDLNINIFPANTWREFPINARNGFAKTRNCPRLIVRNFESVFESSRIRSIYTYIVVRLGSGARRSEVRRVAMRLPPSRD